MNNLHESHIGKTRKLFGYILSILPSMLILVAGIGKVFGIEAMLENMYKVTNFGNLIVFVGVLELTILALYWIPKTSNLGFLLMCSFCGGIIVAEIVTGQVPMPGIILSTMFYVGTILRKPSVSGMNL